MTRRSIAHNVRPSATGDPHNSGDRIRRRDFGKGALAATAGVLLPHNSFPATEEAAPGAGAFAAPTSFWSTESLLMAAVGVV